MFSRYLIAIICLVVFAVSLVAAARKPVKPQGKSNQKYKIPTFLIFPSSILAYTEFLSCFCLIIKKLIAPLWSFLRRFSFPLESHNLRSRLRKLLLREYLEGAWSQDVCSTLLHHPKI